MDKCGLCKASYDRSLRIGPMRSYCQACFQSKLDSYPATPVRYYEARDPDGPPWTEQTFHRMGRRITIDLRLSYPSYVLGFRRGTQTKVIDLGYKLLAQGGHVVDVGANFGELVAHWAPIADSYVAVEPVPVYWDLIERNAKQNGSAVTLVKKALSNRSGVSSFKWTPTGGDRAHLADKGSLTVELTTLDNLSLRAMTFLKVDVEGHELPVIQGGRDTLATFKPHVVLEVNPKWTVRYDYTVKDLVDEMHKLGYHARLLDGSVYEGQSTNDLWFTHKGE